MKKIYACLLTIVAMFSVQFVGAQSYCTPTYTFGCSSNDYIDLCTTTGGVTNINNVGSGCNGNPNNYIDYSASQILTIAPGGTFNFTVQSGSAFVQGFRIWMDYNDNGSFLDPGEDVWNSGFASTSAFTGSIVVPMSATGVTIMRVRCTWNTVPTDPCANNSYGETEDYGVVFCIVPPTPTVTSPVNACVGGPATLNASVASGTLTWYDVSTGGTAQGTGPSFTTPPFTVAGPDTFWVASEDGGCSSPRVPIYVNVAAQVVVNIGADTTVCGTSYVLDAGHPGSTYLWSSGQGTQTINITTSGTYSVNLITPIGCQGTDQISVALVPPPNYTLGNDTSTCGNNVVLDAGSGYSSYAWSTGSTSQTTSVSTNDTVGVTVIDANGCVLNDTVIVTLNPAPVVNIGPDITQCGGSAVLDAGNPGALYFWSNSTSSQQTTVNATGVYYVDVLTQAGCAGSDTVNVTINNQPVANLGPDTSICLSTVILDAGNPGASYLWSNSMTTQTVTVGTGTYDVLITDPSGCSDRDTISVTTNVPPVVTVSQDTSICPGGTAILTASGALTYIWSNNATGSTLPVSPTATTAYYVTGTDINGCQASDVVVVNMLSGANAQFTLTQGGATVYTQNQSTMAYTYSWNFGDSSPADNTASPTHTYTQNGTYTITLTVTGACGTDTYTMVVTITEVGVGESDISNTLSIFPNPNNGHFTVSFAMEAAQDVTIEMTDVAGRVISSTQLNNASNVMHEMDATDIANGVYFVRIITADEVITRKVSVQK